MRTGTEARTDGLPAGAAAAKVDDKTLSSGAGAPALWHGLGLTFSIAAVAFAVRQLPGLASVSPMILAILIAMGLSSTIGTPNWARSGARFAMRWFLRAGIVLLGLQITASDLAVLGLHGATIVAVSLAASYGFTLWVGRRLGVDRELTQLIAAGTSICGASAVIAVNTVVRARDEDVAYAVGSVTIFGSIAMLVYPILAQLLALPQMAFGLWAGASIHEIAQVVAAAFAGGNEAGESGTIAKLLRVVLLAPTIVLVGLLSAPTASNRDERSATRIPIPWFVIGFLSLVALNSILSVPAAISGSAPIITSLLLSTALAALGLEISWAQLRARGPRPLMLGLAASLFISLFSLLLVLAV